MITCYTEGCSRRAEWNAVFATDPIQERHPYCNPCKEGVEAYEKDLKYTEQKRTQFTELR